MDAAVEAHAAWADVYEVLITRPPEPVTCSVYEVAPELAFHVYVGVVVVIAPVGDTVAGVAGAGTTMVTVMVRGALQAPVPMVFVARTNQLYAAPLVSAFAGVTVQVPVPAAHPAAVAVYVRSNATPAVFWASSSYEVTPAMAFHAYER